MTLARVAVVGLGEIGRVVADSLANGDVGGATLGAVVTRHQDATSHWPRMSFDAALDHCEIVVECAGRHALADLGPQVVSAAKTLVVTSVGALLEPALMDRLNSAPGRWVCTTGAIGGLDILSAARRWDAYETVSLTTTKLPRALQQPWMSDAESTDLLELTEARELFHGDAREAGDRFPSSLNVAAALALATGCPDIQVKLWADPRTAYTRHEIHAIHPAGEYRFTIDNAPSPSRPSTSAVTAYGVTRTLQLLVDPAAVVL